jgi:mannose-6-phosphate isomerase-like protein (cupin superfamily)
VSPRGTLKAGDRFVSPRTGASLAIVALSTRASGEIVVERGFPADGRTTPTHLHLDFAERFEILEGLAEARIEGATVRLAVGDVLYVDPTAPHVNPHSAGGARLVVRHAFLPPRPDIFAYLRTLGQVLEDGRDDGGELPFLAALAVFNEVHGKTYLDRVPIWSQRRLIMPAGARLARKRGYDVWLTR